MSCSGCFSGGRTAAYWRNTRNPDDGLFYSSGQHHSPDADCCFGWYTFDIRKCAGYDTKSGTVVAQTIYLEARESRVTQMVSKTTDGHKVTYAVDFIPCWIG